MEVLRNTFYRSVYRLSRDEAFNRSADWVGNRLRGLKINYALGATRAAASLSCTAHSLEAVDALGALMRLVDYKREGRALSIMGNAVNSGRIPCLRMPEAKDAHGVKLALRTAAEEILRLSSGINSGRTLADYYVDETYEVAEPPSAASPFSLVKGKSKDRTGSGEGESGRRGTFIDFFKQ